MEVVCQVEMSFWNRSVAYIHQTKRQKKPALLTHKLHVVQKKKRIWKQTKYGIKKHDVEKHFTKRLTWADFICWIDLKSDGKSCSVNETSIRLNIEFDGEISGSK